MRNKRVKNFKRFKEQFEYSKVQHLKKYDRDAFIDYASTLVANDKMHKDTDYKLFVSRSDSDDECNAVRKQMEMRVLNAKMHNSKRSRLKKYYLEKKEINWQGIVADIKYRSENNIWILIDHAVELDALYERYNQNELSKYVIDYHIWINVKTVMDLPNNRQEIAIGDFIRATSAVSKYGTNGHARYGIGATKIRDCGVIVENDSLLSYTSKGFQIMNGFVNSKYIRNAPILTLTKHRNFELIIQRFNSLYSANNNKVMLYDSDFNKRNKTAYGMRLKDSNFQSKRKQEIKESVSKEIKLDSEFEQDLIKAKQLKQSRSDLFCNPLVPREFKISLKDRDYVLKSELELLS